MGYDDGVLIEVREAREAYSRLFGFDIAAIVADMQRRNEQGDWPVAHPAPRRPAGFEEQSAASEGDVRSAGVGEEKR